MKRFLSALAFAFIALTSLLAAAATDPGDKPGSKDPALFNRMPGFHIYRYEPVEFDRFNFPTASGKVAPVEGQHLYIIYTANDGLGDKLPSALQIARNYSNAIRSVGGQVVYEFEDGGSQFATLKLQTNGAEVWAYVGASGNGQYDLHIIEKQAMSQAVLADAKSLLSGIRSSGRVAVYGIYFDTDKAEVKPESAAALGEIAKMLAGDVALKLYVVGHTDSSGDFGHNLKLSTDRAIAVTNALSGKFGIARTRLTPYGDGPTAPVASNSSDEGRAKNRRVELVAQ